MRVGYTSRNKANMLTKRQLKVKGSMAPVHARPSLWFGSNQRDLIILCFVNYDYFMNLL